jgi:hypothetical protein
LALFFLHNRLWERSGMRNVPACTPRTATRSTMRCPKCQFDHELQTTECLKCGIVFSRYRAAQEAAAKEAETAAPAVQGAAAIAPLSPSVAAAESSVGRNDVLKELKYRALALPLALLVARMLAGTGFRFVASMLAMVLHESGHAITSWLTGRWAVPTLWVTMRGEDRSWLVILMLTAAILFGGFLAWKAQRWGWVCAAGAALLVQLIFLSLPNFTQGALIVFDGDGGALILASILMMTFYAPRESKLYKSGGLRWGLLAIGALSFMSVYCLWSGPIEDIPFGEIEGVNFSDPTLLTDKYGWSVTQLVDRYNRLAMVCLGALIAVYVWGLVAAYLEARSLGRDKSGSGNRTFQIAPNRGELRKS